MKKRMANLELLRIIAMMMVVVLHFLGKGYLLTDLRSDSIPAAGVTAWILESLCVVAVNVYMLISGYFLCESSFKLSRLLKLWIQVWCYSAVVGLLAAGLGIVTEVDVDIHFILTLLFPISMGHYWFMTAYVYLYLMLPFVGIAVKHLSKKQMEAVIGLLLLTFSLLKSILPVRLEMDKQGYDVIWYLCVFLVAAYIRRYGVPFLEKKRNGIILYLLGSGLIFGWCFLLRSVYLHTGRLDDMVSVSMEYNHLFNLLAAVGVFAFFLQVKVPDGAENIICKLAPYSLGVYLLHENLGIRYTWERWFPLASISTPLEVALWALTAAVTVFAVGVLVDFIRDFLTKALHKGLLHMKAYGKICEGINHVDNMFTISK